MKALLLTFTTHFKVMADIDLSAFTGTSFNIIGYYREWDDNKPFTGVFDGNGKRIANFSYTSTDRNYVGLFGYVDDSNAEIKDLRLIDANIHAGTGDCVGSVVGQLDHGTITGCYVEGGNVAGHDNVGGLVGAHGVLEIRNLILPFTISNCYCTSSVQGTTCVGGLVGLNASTISNCYASGSVIGNDCAGGLVGQNGYHGWDAWGGVTVVGTILNCYSTGFVLGQSSVGGLVGLHLKGTVSGCFWDMQTSGRTRSAGGTGKTTAEMQRIETYCDAGWDFVGEINNGLHEVWQMPEAGGYPRISIFDGYTPPQLQGSGTPENPYLISDAPELGAMIYCSRKAHYRLVASIDLSGIRWCMPVIPTFMGVFDGGHAISHLTITGAGYLGLFGRLEYGAKVKNLGVADVNIMGSKDYVGGLVGSNRRGHVTQCYSTGTVDGSHSVAGLVGSNSDGHVSQCYSIGAVTGDSSVGGLVGWNSWDATVTHCYSSGSVLGTADVGGLIGEDGGKVWAVWASFWDIETSGQTTSADGTGKTTVQMQTRSTFTDAGWDFVGESVNGTDDIWWILEGRSYPRLWWQYGWAFSAHPPDGAIDVTQPLILSWIAGGSNLHHDVYFGDDEQAVANATTETAGIYRGRQAADVTTYDPGILELDKTYYWRIDGVDEADANSPWKGNVWSFTTANFIVVDDFEAYDDYCNRIFYTWLDGCGHSADPGCGVTASAGNGSGWNACPGPIIAPFAEQNPIVHGGCQSMPGTYDNSGAGGLPRYSETGRTWAVPQDWTREGVKALTLWFYGDPCNAAEPLYVAVEDSMGKIKVINHDDANAVQLRGWQEWNIDLKQFTGTGLNLEAVKKMYIGVGDRDAPQRGGTGQLYFDDIRLYRPRCIASIFKPEADLSGNCVVDLADIAILASQWLQSGAGLAADLDADGDVDFGDFAQIADAWLEQLLWPQP